MIKSLSIRNLQSHKDSYLEFAAPGVNVIVGKSRGGKTALLRAIRKALENRPIIGIERWVHGQDPKGTISITLETTDDHVITWEGPNPQQYIVDGETLAGFGQSVPPQVSEALNLGEINIQSQHDRPYLLFDSPGEVARTLNRVVNLDIIDTALANVAALARQNVQDIRVRETRLGELRELEAGFPDLGAAEEFISDLEDQEREIKEKQAKAGTLRVIQDRLAGLKSRLAQCRVPDGVEVKVNTMAGKQADLGRKQYTLVMLQEIQQSLTGFRNRAKTLAPVLGQEDKVIGLLGKQAQIQAKRKQLTRIRGLNESIQRERQGLLSKTAIIGQEEQELEKIMPPECPLCGQEARK